MKRKQRDERRRAKTRAQAQRSHAGERAADRARSDGHRAATPGTDAFRREQTVKSARWNRFMLIRYLDAGLFFVGLYWCVMALAFGFGWAAAAAAVEALVAALVMVEVISTTSTEAEYIVWSHRLLIASAVLKLAVTLALGPQVLFPFFAEATPGVVLCGALLAIKALIIHRIVLVRDRRDRRYERYRDVLKYNDNA